MQQNSGQNRNFSGRKIMDYAGTIHEVLVREYAPLRFAAKILARATGVSVRTSQNWLQGVCAPRGDELISLMAASPTVRAEVMALVESRVARAENGLKRITATRDEWNDRKQRFAEMSSLRGVGDV